MTADVVGHFRRKNELAQELQHARQTGEAPDTVLDLANRVAELEYQIALSLPRESAIPNLISAATYFAQAQSFDKAQQTLEEAERYATQPSVLDEVIRMKFWVDVVGWQNGHNAASTRVNRWSLPVATSIAAQVLGQHAAEIDDVAQEALIVANRAKRKLQDPGGFEKWFYTIVRNKAIDQQRWWRRYFHHLRRVARGSPQVLKKAVERDELMEMLPDINDRSLLERRYWEKATIDEIASQDGVSTRTVRRHLIRITGELKEKLETWKNKSDRV